MRQSWSYRLTYFACLIGAGAAIIFDGACSWQWLDRFCKVDWLTSGATLALSALASSVGALVFTKESWISFTYQVPLRIAGIEEDRRRIAEIFGLILSGGFLLIVIAVCYWANLVSNRVFFRAQNVGEPEATVLALGIMLLSDALLVLAKKMDELAKISKRATEDFDAGIATRSARARVE